MRDNARFYIPVLTVLTLIGTVVLVKLISRQNGWSLCSGEDCNVQDWLSATSGWVGFGAAALGAYFVYHQLAEQRKQTAFLLGDGEPTLQPHIFSFDSEPTVLRIVNWNRRTVSIERIWIKCDGVDIPKPIVVRWFDEEFRGGCVSRN